VSACVRSARRLPRARRASRGRPHGVGARARSASASGRYRTVNPRHGGLANSLVQAWKRLVARVLDWHVREQVEFNRQVLGCLDAAIEAFNEDNRALVELGNRIRARWKGRKRIFGPLRRALAGYFRVPGSLRQEVRRSRRAWARVSGGPGRPPARVRGDSGRPRPGYPGAQQGLARNSR